MTNSREESSLTRDAVNIPCGTLVLEGLLEVPNPSGGPCPAALLCHPHPLYGGNMLNNVIEAVARGLLELGFACLRFNFRGTGRSQGTHGNGISELDDVRAALDFLVTVKDLNPKQIVVAGYSFGCWVGLKAAVEDDRPALLIGISPPVDMYDYGFLKTETRPKLLLAGERDFVCSLSGFNALIAEIPDPKEGVIIPDSDHFHFGREKYVVKEVAAFLTRHEPMG
ncbi:MAG: alpha/beta fold hydrolase [Pseudomonadota bacterium]